MEASHTKNEKSGEERTRWEDQVKIAYAPLPQKKSESPL